jgi:hypothetical protein
VAVEVSDAVCAEKHDAEVRAHHDDESAENAGEDADERSGENVAREPTQKARITVGQEVPEADEGDAAAGVDVVVGAADEAVEVLFECARGAVGANGGEICGGLAVEEAEVAEFGRWESLDTGGLHLAHKRIETVPVILARIDPEIADHAF